MLQDFSQVVDSIDVSGGQLLLLAARVCYRSKNARHRGWVRTHVHAEPIIGFRH